MIVTIDIEDFDDGSFSVRFHCQTGIGDLPISMVTTDGMAGVSNVIADFLREHHDWDNKKIGTLVYERLKSASDVGSVGALTPEEIKELEMKT